MNLTPFFYANFLKTSPIYLPTTLYKGAPAWSITETLT